MHRVPNVSYILHVHQHFDHSYLFHGRTFCLPPVGLHHRFQLKKMCFHVIKVCNTWYYITFKTILSVSARGGGKKKIAFWRVFYTAANDSLGCNDVSRTHAKYFPHICQEKILQQSNNQNLNSRD
mmetsp:Transcript_3509/g.4039  ORF Transcript_3509/g.4039 Transcript_3509/m.4039 type:complete len:125 (-) Transcript_3509:128-502(-)